MFLSENGGKHQKHLLKTPPFFRVNTAAPKNAWALPGMKPVYPGRFTSADELVESKKGLPAFSLWQFNLSIENGDFPYVNVYQRVNITSTNSGLHNYSYTYM